MVGDKIILDSKHIHEDDRRTFQRQTHLVQGFTQQRIELLADIVDGRNASMLIEVAVIIPGHRKLLRHASQRSRSMYPELPGSVLVQPLQFRKDIYTKISCYRILINIV